MENKKMNKLNLTKELAYLSSLGKSADIKDLTEDEQWELSDKLAQPLKRSMIKELKEDIQLLNAAIKDLEKPGIKWDLGDFLANLQGIAVDITKMEDHAKKNLKYN
jgi:hypothetical protein